MSRIAFAGVKCNTTVPTGAWGKAAASLNFAQLLRKFAWVSCCKCCWHLFDCAATSSPT